MQFPGRERPPVLGVVYNTTLRTPDAALAVALLYELETLQRDLQVGAISVTDNSFGSAAFVDAVYRFYQVGRNLGNGNRVLRTGLAGHEAFPEDSKMVKAALGRVKEDGSPAYERGIKKFSDTAEPSAQMRNALAFFQDGWVNWILSAPATYVAKILEYQGTKELIQTKVRTLIVSECDQDVPAMRRVLAEWPTPIVFVATESGQAVPFPASAVENGFKWAPAHPVVDFYRAYSDMPYDSPSTDLVAAFYAARTESEFLKTEKGTIEVLDSGQMRFTPSPDGEHQRLLVVPEKKQAFLSELIELVTKAPAPPPPRRTPPLPAA